MNFGGRDLGSELGIAALSLVFAVLTYRLVEMPVRNWRRRLTRAGMVAIIGPATCIVVASVGYVWALQVAPRWLPSIEGLAAPELAARDDPPTIHHGVLLGDSHASVVHAAFKEYAARAGASLTLIARAGCPPLLQIAVNDHRGQPVPYCPSFFQNIALSGNEFVILMARWNYYFGLPPSDPFFQSVVLADIGERGTPTDPYELLASGLAAVFAASERAGVRRVLVVGPLPEFPVDPPYCLLRALRVGGDGCRLDRAAVDARRARTIDTMRQVMAGRKDARLIDPIGLFCTASDCRPHEGRTVYFSDSNHLSPAGEERLLEAYKSDFLWALTGDNDQMTLR
jgi:SGNH domain (fused to AT3 domains)